MQREKFNPWPALGLSLLMWGMLAMWYAYDIQAAWAVASILIWLGYTASMLLFCFGCSRKAILRAVKERGDKLSPLHPSWYRMFTWANSLAVAFLMAALNQVWLSLAAIITRLVVDSCIVATRRIERTLERS